MTRAKAPLGLFIALLTLAGLAPAAARADPPVRHEARQVHGLQRPARIVVDPWGIAHIYAASQRDAFFLQGYNAARDRLWQIDLWRKRGLGRLSESFGPAYVAQDRAARLFLYRGDMNREWAAYGPTARRRAEAFAAGVNAYVAEIRAGTRPLPPEFRLTGSQPAEWTAEDIVRIRSHALSRNLDSEVARARVACASGLAADALRRRLEPAWTTRVPAGLDPCAIPADVLADYELATRDVSFAPAAASTSGADAGTPERLALMNDRASAEGSNNWVVGPSRTNTGRPILANDPHRALGVPSLRYIVGMDAPGLHVIGAGEPALPGVSVGHNDAIAFGLTIFAIDQDDLYVYETNPQNPLQYRYRGRWETMRRVTETIAVRGGAPRTVELYFTRHGAVIRQDAEHHRAFAVRSVWFEPGTNAYFGSIQYMDARNWTQFRAAMAHWGAPSENLVFASTAGDIGWIAAGLAPIRRTWDGLMPVPGDGRYEWAGFMRAEDLPILHNPSEGWWASANEMNLPPDYPIDRLRVGFEWANPSRINRIKAVLAANAHVSVADSMALQTDPTSSEACRLKALLANLTSDNADAALGLRLLQGWDCRETIESGPAALYEIWAVRHLGPALAARTVPAAARPIVGDGWLDAVVNALEHPDASFGPTPAALRDAVLLESLASAVADTRQRLGPDPAAWRWGDLHQAHFVPAAARMADPALAERMSVGPTPVRGSASTPAAATWRPPNFNAVSGASVRMVFDVGAWDNSMAVNSPGQSGDPESPHYRDLFPLWATGRYAPLLFSPAAVAAASREVMELRPAQ